MGTCAQPQDHKLTRKRSANMNFNQSENKDDGRPWLKETVCLKEEDACCPS
jgi:hypothetical protein